MEYDFFIPNPPLPPPPKFKRAGCDSGPHFSTHLQAEFLLAEEVGKSRRSPPLENLLKKSFPKCSAIYMHGRIYYEASASGPHHLGGPHQNFNAVSKADFFIL